MIIVVVIAINLSNSKLTQKKKSSTSTGFKPMVSVLGLQCSTETHTLGAGQFVEFILTREWNET